MDYIQSKNCRSNKVSRKKSKLYDDDNKYWIGNFSFKRNQNLRMSL